MLFSRKKIGIRRNLADKLRSARKKKGVNLIEAEKDTKISMKYLYALEHSRFDELPADVYVRGFLIRYAEYLGIKPNEVLKRYKNEKRFFDNIKNIKKHSDQVSKNLLKPELSKDIKNISRFSITPEIIVSATIITMVILLLGYIWFQVKSFAAPPYLEIANHDAEIVVSMDKININGKTDVSANLSINGEAVSVSDDGSFSQEVCLSKGINNIEIVATNKANKETRKTIQILNK